MEGGKQCLVGVREKCVSSYRTGMEGEEAVKRRDDSKFERGKLELSRLWRERLWIEGYQREMY